MGGAGLEDGLVEQPLGLRRAQKAADAQGSRTLAEDGDVRCIPAETGDVVAHPFKRADLVQDAFGAARQHRALDGVAQVEKAEAAEPVIERDHDHVAEPGEVLTIVHGTAARADRKGPAVDPDHHGALAAVQTWRPHVEVEAILGLRADLFGDDLVQQACALQRRGSDLEGLVDATPGLKLAGRSPSSGTDWRLGEGHALEGVQASFAEAL